MENIKNLIAEDLNYIDSVFLSLWVEDNEILKELGSFLSSPNKRIRSIFSILCLKTYGIKNLSFESYEILIAGELIHNASLLHDDVLDEAGERRGHMTICRKFSPKISILLGDLLASYATERLYNIKQRDVVLNFQKCIKEMCDAEINQYLLRGILPSIEQYLKICKGKTAVLFKTILECLFLVNDIGSEDLAVVAEKFGLLFQLKNDMEKFSAQIDNKNGIYTAKDIIGIEKTNLLIDNYTSMLRREFKEFPKSIYRDALEDLLGKI